MARPGFTLSIPPAVGCGLKATNHNVSTNGTRCNKLRLFASGIESVLKISNAVAFNCNPAFTIITGWSGLRRHATKFSGNFGTFASRKQFSSDVATVAIICKLRMRTAKLRASAAR
eukprot:GABV01002368.1.p2 GENE.GABV01002368.1~~GABV01002368.1.p2  ORF type:complete len:116 (+),score=32.33 GABV01002368.1:286-633(+)